MYISNDSRNRHFVIKEETGGNNNQAHAPSELQGF